MRRDQHILFFTNEIAVIAAATQQYSVRRENTYLPSRVGQPNEYYFNQNRHNHLIHSTLHALLCLLQVVCQLLYIIDLYVIFLAMICILI